MNDRILRFDFYLTGQMVSTVLHGRGNSGTDDETLQVRQSIAAVKFWRTRRKTETRRRYNQESGNYAHGSSGRGMILTLRLANRIKVRSCFFGCGGRLPKETKMPG